MGCAKPCIPTLKKPPSLETLPGTVKPHLLPKLGVPVLKNGPPEVSQKKRLEIAVHSQVADFWFPQTIVLVHVGVMYILSYPFWVNVGCITQMLHMLHLGVFSNKSW